MKLVISVVAALVLLGLIVALGRGSGDPEPVAVGTAASASTSTSTNTDSSTETAPPADSGEAVALMREVVAAYRKETGFTDKMNIVYSTPNGDQRVTYEVALGQGMEAAMKIPKYRMVVRGDSLYVLKEKMEHKYLEVPLEGDPMKNYGVVSNGRPVPMHFAMMWTDDVSQLLPSLTMGQLTNPGLGGVTRDVPHPTVSGATAHEIEITADNGSGRLFVSSDSNLLAATEMEFVGSGEREFGIQIGFEAERFDRQPALLDFDPKPLFRVTSMQALDQIGVGEPMPEFRLLTADGKILRKRHILGSVTVLDFWATWCGPCKRALPLLEQFSVWSEQTGEPIRVFAVDVWEKFPSKAAKAAAANNYWNSQNFTVPLLLDIDDELIGSLGFSSIPTTLVIDPEGNVAKVHRGYDQKMTQTLQADVQAILSRQGS